MSPLGSPRFADRLVALLAIVACVALLARVVDVKLPVLAERVTAPPPPVDESERDAALDVLVQAATAPVSGATVRVFWERAGRYYLAGSARSDGDGRAHLDALPRGAVWVLVEAPGLARSSTQLVLEGGPRLAEVTLLPAASLAVTVSDEQGALLPRATVLVTTGDPLPFGALTGDDGVARFARLGASPWTIKGSAPGYESVTQSGVTMDATLVLRRLASISVRVEQPSGGPAAGATVLIAGSSLWPARRAETDSNGAARITGLVAGSYDLRATLGELASETLVGFELGRGGTETVTLRLAPGRMVTALVTDDDPDHPALIPNADVVLAEGGLTSFPLRGRTGTDGTVVLGPIPAGPATLSATAPNFVARAATLVPEPLEGPVPLVLLRAGTLHGEVVDAKGNPVDGASVEVIGNDLAGLPIAETPELMMFRRTHFEWALGGPAPLIPAGELGVMPGPIPPIPNALSSLPIDVVPGGALAPSDAAPSETIDPWVTRFDGTFTARPVTPGRVRALVRHPAYVEGLSDAVTLGPGGSAKVKLVLLAGGTLEGRVVDASGRGVSGARVDLTALRGTLERTTLTASDGTFAFAAVPAEVVLSVARPEDLSRIVVRKALEIEEGQKSRVEIALPAPRDAVTILVRDDAGRPIEGAQISLLSVDPATPLRQTGFSSAEGAAAFADARGLDLRVVVEAPGWAVAMRAVEGAGERIEIALSRGVLVAGKVTAVRGRRALEGASVVVIHEGRRAAAVTNADGAYRIRDVAPGPVRVLVSHPDHALAELDAEVEPTGRDDRPFELPTIDLAEPASVEGEVLDAIGRPVLGARVAAGVVPAYLPAGTLPSGMAVTDAKGRFKLDGLAPGKVDLEAYAADVGRGAARGLQVTAGRPTRGVSIRLSGPVGDDAPASTGSVAVTLGERGAGDQLEIVIVHVADGSEAERATLRVGDVILAVDGVEVGSMQDARARLSGPAGSDVVVDVGRGEQELKLRVGREQIRR